MILVGCAALEVNEPSNQEEQEAHTEHGDRLLLDVWQEDQRNNVSSGSACHPLGKETYRQEKALK